MGAQRLSNSKQQVNRKEIEQKEVRKLIFGEKGTQDRRPKRILNRRIWNIEFQAKISSLDIPCPLFCVLYWLFNIRNLLFHLHHKLSEIFFGGHIQLFAEAIAGGLHTIGGDTQNSGNLLTGKVQLYKRRKAQLIGR